MAGLEERVIAPCGTYYNRRSEACVKCEGGRVSACACVGCRSGFHSTKALLTGAIASKALGPGHVTAVHNFRRIP